MMDDRNLYANVLLKYVKTISETTSHDELMKHLGIAGLYVNWLMDAQMDYAKEHPKLRCHQPNDATDMRDVLDCMLATADKKQAEKMNFYIKSILYSSASRQLAKT